MQYQQKLNIFHIVWAKFRDNIPELNLSQTRFSNPYLCNPQLML